MEEIRTSPIADSKAEPAGTQTAPTVPGPATVPMTTPSEPISSPSAPRQRSLRDGLNLKRVDWRILGGVALVVIVIPLWRATTGHAKPTASVPAATPVAVYRVVREDLADEVQYDAELRPYQEVDLHSKVAGFLQDIRVDIGDRIEKGQLLATIEVPELDDDIVRAHAALKRNEQNVASAKAAYDEAHLIYQRLSDVNKAQPNLIAQQELDGALEKDQTTSSSLAAATAEVDVARADIAKLETMLKYTRITAPFAGIITKRYVDPGSLIQAGVSSSTQALPLVRLSQIDKLRLDVPVSVAYVSRIKTGDPVEVRVESCNSSFSGTIARTTHEVDSATRKMIVEADVQNPDFKLVPGMYASVSLRPEHRDQTLAVPVEAVSREKSTTVLVVNQANKIEQREIKIGLETPNHLEVLAGLKENEMVVIGSTVRPGQLVQPRLAGGSKEAK
jgi:RND family efflux transporter MFP subunit